MNFSSVLKNNSLSPSKAFQELLSVQLGQLHSRLKVLRPKSSNEEIHQLRVLTRRTRATCLTLLSVRTNRELKILFRNLKSLTRALGPIRAFDVSYETLKALSEQRLSNGQSPYDFLIKVLKCQRRERREKMNGKLKKRKRMAVLVSVNLAEYWSQVKNEELTRAFFDQVEQSSGFLEQDWQKFQNSQEVKDLHRVRIRVKKLRYLQEISSQYFCESPKSFFQEFKQVQDRLGYIHDLQVLVGHLQQKRIRETVKKKSKARQKLHRKLIKNLKASIESKMVNFYRDGGPMLQSLRKGMSG